MELNDPQLVAAMHTRGALLVFAGAGSGKTRVITYRIANLVATEHVAPYRILAVTFTNKAAGEMRHRLEGMLGTDIARDLWVGTFHATSAKLLRRFGTPADDPLRLRHESSRRDHRRRPRPQAARANLPLSAPPALRP